MAIRNNEKYVKNILVLAENLIPKTEFSQFIQMFTNLSELNGYIYDHIKDVDNFDLHISGVYLEELIKSDIYNIKQVHCIYVYCDNEQARQSGTNRFHSESKEGQLFKFCLERALEGQLENAEAAGALNPSSPINHSIIDNVATLKMKRLHDKRNNCAVRSTIISKDKEHANQTHQEYYAAIEQIPQSDLHEQTSSVLHSISNDDISVTVCCSDNFNDIQQ